LTRQETPQDLRIALNYRAADAAIAETLALQLPANTPVIDVWNKSDSASAELLGGRTGVVISAKTGAGLTELRQQLLQVVGWQAAPEGVFMARERHVSALRQVDAQLAQAAAQLGAASPALDLLAEDLRQAQNALSAITGEFTPDDLLGEIFSKFCIGK
ncbi:MAG: tRNA uridine-5-carboxymethylaminomethyl(34) synthesis GTPase MnmE, partial [Polaromonas sp.]|nr:tRNA uridine-5-carboxymethylaminomethyl(34) synthesis GTPase MnmE [Polaromonas sp.]